MTLAANSSPTDINAFIRRRGDEIRAQREPLGLNVHFKHPDGTVDVYSYRDIEAANAKRRAVLKAEGYELIR